MKQKLLLLALPLLSLFFLIPSAEAGYGYGRGYGGYYGGDLGYHGYGQRAYVAPSDDYSGNGGRSLGGSLLGRGARYGHGYGYGGYGYGRDYDYGTREEEMEHSFKKPAPKKHAW